MNAKDLIFQIGEETLNLKKDMGIVERFRTTRVLAEDTNNPGVLYELSDALWDPEINALVIGIERAL